MTIRYAQYLILTFGVLLMAGCEKKASEEIDFGTLENSVYQNTYFDLQLAIPPEWSVQDQEMRKSLMDAGSKMFAGEDKEAAAVIKASEMQSVNLLTAFKHPVGTPVSFNPSVICLAERVRSLPGIKLGKDYHYHTKKLLQSGQIDVEFPKEIYTEKLGGVDFDVMDVSMNISGVTILQKYYASIVKGYALSFIVSYSTPEEELVLQNIMQGVTFN